MSNQRPNSAVEFRHTAATAKATIHFDAADVCDACRLAEAKKGAIDWEKREHELRALCDRFRSRNGSYDCLVPGSGGKDSFYAAHKLKYEYGMHPLTVTWAPHMYTEWGWRNFQAWIHAGFDNYLCTPNGRIHRLLTRLAVENLFHPFQPFMLGQKGLAPKMALLFGIPLVFFGENEAEYGNPLQDSASAQRSWDYFTSGNDEEVFLGGTSVASLKSDYGLVAADLEPYLPVDPMRIADAGVEVHYLGYYLKWHPQGAYYYAVEHGGLRGVAGTHAGDLFEVQQHRRPDRRLPLLHDVHQVRDRSGDVRRLAGGALGRDHARGGGGADQAVRRRVPGALRRRDPGLSEPAREGIPAGLEAVRAADHGPRLLRRADRPLPLAASVAIRGRQMVPAQRRLDGFDGFQGMSTVRLIPRLDIKGPNLIKGIRLEGLRVVGDPHEYAQRYYEAGADELVYMDIVASLYGRNNLTDIVRRAAQDVFVPMTVGGGIRSVDDVRTILRAGADKVAVNTAAVARPELITEVARLFGSQCMVLSIEAKRRPGREGWEAFTDNGREHTGLDAVDWAARGVELGAGEILLTSVDQEGTRKGFDVDLVREISTRVPVPVIASGGMGSAEDLVKVAVEGKADAVAMADILHWDRMALPDIREAARRAGIPVRRT